MLLLVALPLFLLCYTVRSAHLWFVYLWNEAKLNRHSSRKWCAFPPKVVPPFPSPANIRRPVAARSSLIRL